MGQASTTREGRPAVGWSTQNLRVVEGYYIVGRIDVLLDLVEQMRLEQALRNFAVELKLVVVGVILF